MIRLTQTNTKSLRRIEPAVSSQPTLLIRLGVLFCGIYSTVAAAQTVPGKSTDISLESEFQETLHALQREYGFPGATAAYVLPDGAAGAVATGLADAEADTPMTPESRMLAASIGKTFVGATAAALALEDKLDLDVPGSRWLDRHAWFQRLPNHEVITPRHLLTHTSGLPDHVHMERFAAEFSRKWTADKNPFPPETLVHFVLDTEPLFEPGEGWAYSDTGYILAGLVLEQAGEKKYYKQVEERFLKPLGLSATSPADRRLLPGLVPGYVTPSNPFGLPRKTTAPDGTLVWHPGLEWTGGGWVTNSRDLARWGWALFSGKAMKREYLAQLLDSVPVNSDSPQVQYGLGVGVYLTGPFGPVYGHGGWIPGYCSSLRYYADHGVAVAFQVNTDIGIADGDTPVMREMEHRLADTVISAIDDAS